MSYAIKPLSCDPARVRGMSEKLIVSHYENNYGGAVKRLNLIDEQLADLDYAKAPGFLINGLKREQLIAMNSMILHELFFDGLGDEGESGVLLKDAIAFAFGSFERWRSEFIAMGKALGGGSGWVLLSWSSRDRKLVNQWGRRSLPYTGGRHADPCARYVRALLPHRLRRQGCDLCRRLHDRDPLGKRRSIVRRTRALDDLRTPPPRMGSFAVGTPIGRRCIGACGDGNCCRVGPGNFTPSLSQVGSKTGAPV
jgi:superoxide dismutase, Fe-Mn family